jgi:hypothetical protein
MSRKRIGVLIVAAMLMSVGAGALAAQQIQLTNGTVAMKAYLVNLDGTPFTVTLEGGSLTVGAQPADDPHFVRCSNSTVASPCEVTATNLDVQSGGADLATQTTAASIDSRLDTLDSIVYLTTTAHDAAFGTAGTPDAQVRSVQGITNGTPLGVAGAATPADNFVNPTTAVTVWALLGCYDGSAWDPCPASSGNIGAPDAGTTRVVQAALPLPFKSLDLDESEEEADDSASELCGGVVTNTSTGTRYVKFYNADADDVTVGTTVPDFTIGIPGNSSDDIMAMLGIGGNGCVAFSTGITVAATTAAADNDTGAPGAGDVIITLFRR